ncbi:MAG TPA: DNA-binding response regulator [Sulfurimonas sp. UBA12504]|nr:MAG: regulator [Sulfurimonas sp. GWF2_37_8]DAB29831.1 MAG TPA: DNA-binding response regulator [Sulfurimonas sp. UBA12504]
MDNKQNIFWIKNRVLKELKVLLIEDEAKLSLLLKNAIGEYFYSFTTASDGEEGLKKFKIISPDIVITDIMMPKRSGLEMAKEMRKIEPNLPIIILSAFSETEKFLSAIDIGVTKYFIKPFDPEELLSYIIEISQKMESKNIQLKDGFTFNQTKLSLYKDGRYISLTKTQNRCIQLLLQHAKEDKKTLDSTKIKENLWPQEEVSDEKVRTFIRRLRQKTSQMLIQTVRGQGYYIK